MERSVFRFVVAGELAEADFIEASPTEWDTSTEKADPAWSVIIDLAGVKALRLPLLRLHGNPAEASPPRGLGGDGHAIGQN